MYYIGFNIAIIRQFPYSLHARARVFSGWQGRHYPSSGKFGLQSAYRRSILTAKGQNWPEVRSIHIMRTKCITICFQIGWLVGFLITNGDIMVRRP